MFTNENISFINHKSDYITLLYLCRLIHKCINVMSHENFFNFKELVSTETGLPNTISSPAHLGNLVNLWHSLNRIRAKFGSAVYVNSAFRSPKVNQSVGGSPNSYHLIGRAADIRPKDLRQLEQLWDAVCSYDKEFGLSEKIRYSTFIHIAI